MLRSKLHVIGQHAWYLGKSLSSHFTITDLRSPHTDSVMLLRSISCVYPITVISLCCYKSLCKSLCRLVHNGCSASILIHVYTSKEAITSLSFER